MKIEYTLMPTKPQILAEELACRKNAGDGQIECVLSNDSERQIE